MSMERALNVDISTVLLYFLNLNFHAVDEWLPVKSLGFTNFCHIVTTLKWWVQHSQMLSKRGIMVKWTVLKKMGKEGKRKE